MALLALWGVALSCRYELPQLPGIDAAVDVSGEVSPVDAARLDAPIDGPPPAPSCVGLTKTCGAGASDDCCRAATVSGGSFYRSYDGVGHNDMSYPATVSTFALDKYEVTVGRFRAFINAGRGTQQTGSPPAAGAGKHPNLPGSGWDSAWDSFLMANTAMLITAVKCHPTYQTWTDVAGTNEDLPMNCVSWYEAMAFCIWDGGYLPTEAEWNYAASGGSEQRAYPWSNPPSSTSIDCTYANYRINIPSGMHCVNDTTGGVNRVGSESPKGDGRAWGSSGHSDLAGNVWEWTLDWLAVPYSLVPCNDCANLTAATQRVLRGGGFTVDASNLLVADRSGDGPSSHRFFAGLRCARTP